MTKVFVEGEDIAQVRRAVREHDPSFIRIELRQDWKGYRLRPVAAPGAIVHVNGKRVPLEFESNTKALQYIMEQLTEAQKPADPNEQRP